MANSPSIKTEYSEYSHLFEIASRISGRVRNASTHAGGVGIVDTEITDYIGMKLGSNNEHVIQVDKRMVEAIGIVKFDILGVSTLSVVQNTLNDVGISLSEFTVDNSKLLNNQAMYDLLCSARTNGIFQVESAGMKDLLTRLKPNNLNDVSAVLALYRPDSMMMLEDYIKYKHNPNQIEYWHEDMVPILQDTYGALIYQEQIMEIVRKFGNRTYGGADLFRRAIGDKDKNLVKEESHKLYNEIVANGYDEAIAKKISDHLSSFGNYCFNRSHSQLYSVLTLKTAFLKANYPVYFFCHLLNENRNDFGSVNKYITDAKTFNVSTIPPKINQSNKLFTVKNNQILFGLEAIKGIGEKFSEQVIDERKKNGSYKSFQDFIDRTNATQSNVIMLVKSGAIPCVDKKEFLIKYGESLFNYSEYTPVKTLPKLSILKEKYNIDTNLIKDKEKRLELYNMYRKIEHENRMKERLKSHMDLFVEKNLQDKEFWEFEALSTFISYNPFEESYKHISATFSEVKDGEDAVVVGIIADVQKKKDRNKNQFAFINIHSADGLIEVICWSSQYKQYESEIKRGNQVALMCKKSEGKAIMKELKTYRQWLKDRDIELNKGGDTNRVTA